MDVDLIYVASIIVAILFLAIAVFQILLSLGYPLGEFAMGGYYKVLPKKLRIVSVANALILLFMGFVFLKHTNVLTGLDFLSTNILVWIITIFLGLNTIANLISRSKKERFRYDTIIRFYFHIMFSYCFIIGLFNRGVSSITETAKLKLSLFYLADSNNLYEQSLIKRQRTRGCYIDRNCKKAFHSRVKGL